MVHWILEQKPLPKLKHKKYVFFVSHTKTFYQERNSVTKLTNQHLLSSSHALKVAVGCFLVIMSKTSATHLSHQCITSSSPALFFTTTLFFKYSPPPLDSSNNWIMAFPSAPNIHWALQTLTTIPLGNKMYLQWKKSTITTSLCPDVCDLATSWETGESWRQPVVKFFSSCLVHSPLGRDPDFMSR